MIKHHISQEILIDINLAYNQGWEMVINLLLRKLKPFNKLLIIKLRDQ